MDLSGVGKIYTADGPFVSVYLDATSQVENAEHIYETKWRNLERDLDEQGVDRATIDAVIGAQGRHSAGNTRIVIASHGTARLALSLPEQPEREVVRVTPLPHVAPLVDAITRVRPYVVALIDRTGADIFAYTTGTQPEEFALVEGEAPDIRKVHGAGAWNMRRMQARAEEGWLHNAKEIADAIERVCRDIDARLIVAAGDTREVDLVHDHLPADRQSVFERVAGGRSADGSAEAIFEHVDEKLEERRTKDVIDLLERFTQNRGRHSLACEGLTDTVNALRSSAVDTLLLTEEYAGSEPLWFGPEPMHLGDTKDDLTAMGVSDPQQTEAIDGVLRVAIATDATIVRVPGGMEQSPRTGIGALLRFDLES